MDAKLSTPFPPTHKKKTNWLAFNKKSKIFFFFLTALRHLCHMQKMKKKNHDFMKTAATVAGGCVSCVPSLHQSLPQVPAQPLRERTKKKFSLGLFSKMDKTAAVGPSVPTMASA